MVRPPSHTQMGSSHRLLGAWLVIPWASCLSVWRQLFWEKKLSGLNAFDIAEELVKTMDLPKGLQGSPGRRPGRTAIHSHRAGVWAEVSKDKGPTGLQLLTGQLAPAPCSASAAWAPALGEPAGLGASRAVSSWGS